MAKSCSFKLASKPSQTAADKSSADYGQNWSMGSNSIAAGWFRLPFTRKQWLKSYLF